MLIKMGPKVCTLHVFADKYSDLVTGEAAAHVKQFISNESSFEDYTQVMVIFLWNLILSRRDCIDNYCIDVSVLLKNTP